MNAQGDFTTFAEAKAWAAANGVDLLVLPAPDKSSIYPAQLPAGVMAAERRSCTR